ADLDQIGGLRVDGTGGPGGSIDVAGLSDINVSSRVTLRANGSDTTTSAGIGSSGGTVRVINLDSADTGVMDFDGAVEVRPGIDIFGTPGTPGVICQRGAGPASVANLTGNNEFPISLCDIDVDGAITDTNFVSHDLDCDSATLLPGSVSQTMPTAVTVDFFRVFVGVSTSVTVEISGEDLGDLDLYAGEDAAVGSIDTSDYAFQSSTPDTSSESIEISLADFTPGQFVSVMVISRNSVPETYTVSVGCSSSTDDE
ncbi:MAG: hypothetical protein AAF488_18515, partial [Planctomycetota bacterium]